MSSGRAEDLLAQAGRARAHNLSKNVNVQAVLVSAKTLSYTPAPLAGARSRDSRPPAFVFMDWQQIVHQ